jgi:hypothetical protein
MRWSAGEAAIEQLLANRHLERVQGAQADGESWLDRARQTRDAARLIAEAAPDSSVVLAYGAARQACVSLLAQQGLRPTTAGGHKAVYDAISTSLPPRTASLAAPRDILRCR